MVIWPVFSASASAFYRVVEELPCFRVDRAGRRNFTCPSPQSSPSATHGNLLALDSASILPLAISVGLCPNVTRQDIFCSRVKIIVH